MNPKYKKIYCCTPISFRADENSFFIRDTGLISRVIRDMGPESKVIMPLPFHADDRRELIIRTEYRNLESAEWWKSLKIDGLVLYSWGAPKYLKIAKAVHQAGIRLLIHMDTSGDFTGIDWENTPILARFIKHLKIKAVDALRAIHLSYADIITGGETALESISRRLFYGDWIVKRGYPMAAPVSPQCCYDGRTKKRIILFIGRWNDSKQKRPQIMMQTLEALYSFGVQVETRILGCLTNELHQWHSSLPPAIAESIHLVGYVPNHMLTDEYNNAQIMVCPSSYESSHIVSCEALCCGASVVVSNLPSSLRTVHWYTTKNSGRISKEDTPLSLAEAIRDELETWETSERDPYAIASAWQPYFHVNKVMDEIFSV